MTNCIRCGRNTDRFPKSDNQLTCGRCLKDLHAMHRAAEDPRTHKYTELA